MGDKSLRNIKLGIFVMAGLLFLIVLLYMIGKNENLFGSNFELKVRFENIQGLNQGNNIRYAGIQAGTVKKVTILNDTLIEVTMLIKTSLKKYIHKNAVASIGTDGLVGNKIINIFPAKETSALVEEGDILACKKTIETNEMLQTLAKTNNDIAFISSELKTTISRINNSKAIWDILNDNTLPQNLRVSLLNAKLATAKANDMINSLNQLISDVKEGKGSLGAVLTDTSFAVNLNEAIHKIKLVGDETGKLAAEMKSAIKNIRNEVDSGKGPANAFLKDSSMVLAINRSLNNIQEGANGFNDIMEAIKHSFLFRSYFRKLEKKKLKNTKQAFTSE
jgi:phospholipid/cholesterol/gamma-HCH transport system substrate-binding protein